MVSKKKEENLRIKFPMHLPAQIPNICSLCVRVNYYQEKGIGKSKHPLKTKTKGFRSKSSIRIQESGLEAASCGDVKSASRQSYGRSALPFSRACTPKTQKPLSFASVPFHSSSLRLSRHPPRRQPSRSPLPPPPPWASSRTGLGRRP